MYPQYNPISQNPLGRLPRRKRTQHCTHADTQHVVVCHHDVEFYKQRSLLLLLYSFCDYLEEQLRYVFHTGSFLFFQLLLLVVCGRQGTSWYLMGTIPPHFTHQHAFLFVSGTAALHRMEPRPRLSMRKGLCGAEGVRSDSALSLSLTHLMRESWQPLLKPCAKGLVRPP